MANNSTQFPYRACLIQNLPVETQHQLRDFTNYGVRPLGMLLAIMGFVCNALVVFTVTRTKSLQQPSLLMLCSLSVTDLIYSSYSLYRDVEVLAHEHLCPSSSAGSSVSHAVSTLCIYATLANLAAISRDRYQAIRKPWWYRNNVTKSRAMVKICVVWLICIVITLLGYFKSKFKFIPVGYTTTLGFYSICFLVIAVSYIGIFLKKNQTTETQLLAAIKREKRLANTVGLILLVLFLTFLPALVSPLALHMAGIMSLKAYRPFYTFFLQLNAFLNPLLNFGRNKEMRAGLKRLLKVPRQVQPQAGSLNRSRNPPTSDAVNISLERVS